MEVTRKLGLTRYLIVVLAVATALDPVQAQQRRARFAQRQPLQVSAQPPLASQPQPQPIQPQVAQSRPIQPQVAQPHPHPIQPQVARPQFVQQPAQQGHVGINTRPQFNPVPVTSAPQPVLPPVTDSCLQCICQASTDCKPTACHLNGPSQYYCGPFLISWAYWADAGKPQDSTNPFAFESCLNDMACAATTVRNYMAKHGRDCDGNGVIDCRDMARIHKAGPGDCQAKWVEGTPYWNTFSQCAF